MTDRQRNARGPTNAERPALRGDKSHFKPRFRYAVGALAPLLLAACGSTTFSPTGPAYPPKPADCRFDVLTLMPAEGVTEIGTVDIEPGQGGVNTHSRLDSFKREIAPHVCQAGGDVAVAQANGLGWYIKATVLKRTGAPAASRGLGAPTAVGEGCMFDTQCKGERICVSGACVDPPRK